MKNTILMKKISFKMFCIRSLKKTVLLIMIVFLTFSGFAKEKRNSFYVTNQLPLVAQPYTALPLRDVESNEEEIILIPYGCTTLRIAEFPTH